jgi:hypothetical protein
MLHLLFLRGLDKQYSYIQSVPALEKKNWLVSTRAFVYRRYDSSKSKRRRSYLAWLRARVRVCVFAYLRMCLCVCDIHCRDGCGLLNLADV